MTSIRLSTSPTLNHTPTLIQNRYRSRNLYPHFVKGKRKAVCLEYMVAKQDGLIGDLKDALLQASAEQQVSRHEMNKEVRQHVVDKEEALKAAGEARGALSVMVKKTTSTINKLEMKVITLGKDILASEQRDEAQKVSMEQFQRVTEKERRQLVIEQGDLAQQQALAKNQLSSLTFQRTLSRRRVRDLETSHVIELEQVKSTSTKDKEVSLYLDLFFKVCSS